MGAANNPAAVDARRLRGGRGAHVEVQHREGVRRSRAVPNLLLHPTR
jgi:hypothetical protein